MFPKRLKSTAVETESFTSLCDFSATIMIPPAESLLKYGNPILVNKHAGKKSSKVNLLSNFFFSQNFISTLFDYVVYKM